MSGEKDERKRQLVAALRSGRWEQCHGVLARESGEGGRTYCCLGVACEVAIEGGLAIRAMPGEGGRILYGHATTGSNTILPGQATAWFGFAEGDPWLKVPDETAAEVDSLDSQTAREAGCERFPATTLNDDYGFTFAQIADCFEYTFLPEDWEVTRASR